jgi:hypothetical protein
VTRAKIDATVALTSNNRLDSARVKTSNPTTPAVTPDRACLHSFHTWNFEFRFLQAVSMGEANSPPSIEK